MLNKQQLDAVSTIEGPLLIIAGAGSGKTRVITHRIAHLISHGVSKKHILALTFTNKASREMRERVQSLSHGKCGEVTMCTFHAFGVLILRKYGSYLGYNRNFAIYDQIDKHAVLKEVLRETGPDGAELDVYALSELISGIKTARKSLDGYDAIMAKVIDEYREHLLVYNAVDFDDLIVLPSHLFEEYPNILEECRQQYRYIMVDEFQDTSTAQYRIVKTLAEIGRNLCVVGDDDQSIYSWRGADYENIELFEHDFPERKEIKLEQNYRSGKDILAAANSVIANNTRRKVKNLWTGKKDVQSIKLQLPDNEREEGISIARSIRSIAQAHRIPFGEFGILVRTNGLMHPIEDALLADNLPYRVSGGTSFFQRKEIRDIICYLRVLANPDDDVSILRIINTPRRGIGKTTLRRMRNVATERSISLFSALNALTHAADSPVPESIREHMVEFAELVTEFRDRLLSGRDMAKSLNDLMSAINYWGYLLAEHKDKDSVAKYKFSNIQRFINMFGAWEHDPDTVEPTIHVYLNRISLSSRDDVSDEEERGKINLMTIHAAKGLEFLVVFVAGAEDRIIPHARAVADDPMNIEEERRLFYVALTRAKQHLILSSCKTRTIQRQAVSTSPSPFLSEIPSTLIQVQEQDKPVDAVHAGDFFERIKGRLEKGGSGQARGSG